MRSTYWIVAVVFFGIIGQVAAVQAGCAACNRGKMAQQGFAAEACSSPCGHSLAPGCCETNHRCCDNVWADYCDRRANVEAFWDAFGQAHYANRWCPRWIQPCGNPVPCTPPCNASSTTPYTTPSPTPAPAAPIAK